MIEEQGPLGISDDREVVELWSSLRREIRRRGVDPETADDLAQESWLRTLRAPPERDGRGLGGWLHVVGVRLVSEFRRSRQNRLARERRVARCEETHDAEDGESRVQRLVAELPSPYREVVYLRFYEDRSLAEIARELGRPAVTVRSQLARGLERLRLRLGEEDRPSWRRALAALVGLRFGRGAWPRLVASLGLAGLAVVGGFWLLGDDAEVAESRSATVVAALSAENFDGRSGVRQAGLDSAPQVEPGLVDPPADPAPEIPVRALAGLVRGFDGRPVAGATLLGGTRTGDGHVLGATDLVGRYVLADVPMESFVWVSAAGHFDSRRLYVRSLAAGRAHDFELPADLGPLEVRVTDHDGRPASDVELSFFSVGSTDKSFLASSGGLEIAPLGSVEARTDEFGLARFRHPLEEQQWFLGRRAGVLILREVVELDPGVGRLELRLPSPARLTGQLRGPDGAAAIGAEVVVRQRDLELYLRSLTDARGRFEFDGLLPGEFTLQAALPDAGSAAQLRGELAEGEVRDLLVDADPRMAIVGKATDAAEPLDGARVALYRAGRHALAADEVRTTGSDGTFLFWVDPELEYWVELTRADSSRACGMRHHVRGGDVVEMTPDDGLERTSALVLRFRAERPELLPTEVKLRSIHPRLSISAAVGADGEARVELPHATFELAAWVPGVGFWRRAEPIQADVGVLDVLVPRPARVELGLDLPRGTSAPARVAVSIGGMNPFGFETLGSIMTEIQLTADAERRFFSGELFPVKASWCVEVAGFATMTEALALRPGELTELFVRPLPANRVSLSIETPREVPWGEAIELVARTRSGELRIPLAETERTHARINLVVELPLDTEELSCTTTRGLSGSVPVGAEPPRRLSLPLR